MANQFLEITEGLRFQTSINPGNEKTRSLKFSLSSEEPLKRYDWWEDTYYWEVLGHESGEVDLGRFENRAMPLLFNHDMDKHLGIITEASLVGGRLEVDSKFSESALGEEKWKDVQDGILTSSSVRYRIKNLEKTGMVDGFPVMRATLWEAIEASLVSVPADPTVGVGRSLEWKIDDTSKLVLPKYRVPVRSAANGIDRHSFYYYLPDEGDVSVSRAAMALESLSEYLARSKLPESQRQSILQENYKVFEKEIRSKMAINIPAKTGDETLPTDERNDELDKMRRELEETRNAQKADRLALETAQAQLRQETLRARYDRTRSKFDALTHPEEGCITPAMMRKDFAENVQDDYKRIADGDLDESKLDLLDAMCERYQGLPKNGKGQPTPFRAYDGTPESQERSKKTVTSAVTKAVTGLRKETAGIARF